MEQTPLTPASKRKQLESSPGEESTPRLKRRNSLSDVRQLAKLKPDKLTPVFLQTLSDPNFAESVGPVLVESLKPQLLKLITESIKGAVESFVQDCTKPLLEKITLQQKTLNTQTQLIHKQQDELTKHENEITQLKTAVMELGHDNGILKDKLQTLEYDVEAQEQYGRRNSIRLHNVPMSNPQKSDEAVVDICQKIGVEINKEDINRSHILGTIKSDDDGNNRYQIICRFRNWKIKNAVYMSKAKLKGNAAKIFMTEDLTVPRQEVVREVGQLKYHGQCHAYWTNNGRIWMKIEESSPKVEITSLDCLNTIMRDL